MKAELTMAMARIDPHVEARAEDLVDRVVLPHPAEQIVGWVPVPRETACECRHDVPAVAIVQVRMGRATTNPARVCEATLTRIRGIFPAEELIVTEVAA